MKESSALEVSIICPILNVKDYIAQTIESVLAQSYEHWELVIMDGASTDGTVEIIERYAAQDSRIKLHSEKDKGVWPATDKGIDLARGEFLAFIYGQDGYVDRDWLKRAMAIFEKDREVALVWGLGLAMSESGELSDGVPMATSHFIKKEGIAEGLKYAYKKAVAIARELLSANSVRRRILFEKLFSRTFFFRFNLFFKRAMPGGATPQKQAWFRYWLDTAATFPDQSMIVDRRVFRDCAPRYGEAAGELGPMVDFFFNFNARGYLAWYLPIYASFGRLHAGNSGQRRPIEMFETSERYFKRILDLRRRVMKNHEPITFRSRSGATIEVKKF
jgi:glycosyltransferase involved in cell wall biosynthesis